MAAVQVGRWKNCYTSNLSKMKIWYVPLEKLEQRMYAQINTQMKASFQRFGVDFQEILPEYKADQIREGGWVMPAAGHCLFCSQQLAILLQHLVNGDVGDNDIIYFDDLWFPGLEALFYSKHLMKKHFSVYGFIHAGSFTYADFVYPMSTWARDLERSWFNACDGIFVGTKQTKNDIVECGLIADSDKVVITGLPFNVDTSLLSNQVVKKENIIIFAHRDDPDKKVDEFFKLLQLFKKRNFDFKFKVFITGGGRAVRQSTRGLFASIPEVEFCPNLTKQEYYNILQKSKVMVSTAIQENFGVCTQEALAFNVVPICPDRLSYHYLLPKEFLYKTSEEAVIMLEKYIKTGLCANLLSLVHHPYASDLIVHRILSANGV